MKIKNISARSILDSRGIPTVEATVTAGTVAGTASVPSGTSTGSHEAKELRDGDRRWNGLGVSKAVSHVNAELAGALKGKDVTDQEALDQLMCELDRTDDKSRLGANAILVVSLACLRTAAALKKVPLWQHVAGTAGKRSVATLPVPMLNVINGGAHADNSLAIQEFMLVPHGFDTFAESLRAGTETYHALAKLLAAQGLSTNVGAEGGFAPNLNNHTAALDLMVRAIEQAGYEPGKQISLALDVAANSFYSDGGYVFEGQPLTAEQLAAEYAALIGNYPIVSIEDPLAEDDWNGWQKLSGRIGVDTKLIGDDLTVTNADRIKQAEEAGILSGVIIKPNQAGTYTEAKTAWQTVTDGGLLPITSHRSGETTDDLLADLTVGLEVPMLKAGAPARGERVAKYNRLLAIEQSLGGSAVYAGKQLMTTNTSNKGKGNDG